MPRFSANLSMMFTELAFLDRFAAASSSGFKAVEFMFPYDYAKEAIVEALAANRLTLVLHNLPAGDWAAGERGIACHPSRVAEFRDGVGRAIDYANALHCPKLNCLVGVLPLGVSVEQVHETMIGNLRFASNALRDAGIEMVIEPVNTRDVPGFAVSRTAQALAIIDEVGSENLKLQYDIYHAQVMEGDLTPTLVSHIDRIGHIQVADNPGRHEPGTGEINFSYLFDQIDNLGYAGFVGCEYKPLHATTDGLGWLQPYQATAPQLQTHSA